MDEIKQREYSLDFLKTAATLLILLHHFQGATGTHYGYVDFANGKFYFGFIVELFFMISGYLAANQIQSIENGRTFRDYFMYKLIRLLPLVFISTLVYAVAYVLLDATEGFSIWKIIVTAFGIQFGGIFNEMYINAHFWYISVLIICYGVFFIITKYSYVKCFNKVYSYIFIVMIGISAISYGINMPFINSNSARGYIAFFTGVLLSISLSGRRINKRATLASVIVVVFSALIIAFRWDWIAYNINLYLVFVLYPAVIILAKSPFFVKLFNHRFWGVAANISYNTYIWHFEFNVLSLKLILRNGIVIDFTSIFTEITYVMIEFGIGTISYFLIETPISRLIKRQLMLSGKKE